MLFVFSKKQNCITFYFYSIVFSLNLHVLSRLDLSVFDHGRKMCRLLTTAGKCGWPNPTILVYVQYWVNNYLYLLLMTLPKEFVKRICISKFLKPITLLYRCKRKLPFPGWNYGNFRFKQLKKPRWPCNSFFTFRYILKPTKKNVQGRL